MSTDMKYILLTVFLHLSALVWSVSGKLYLHFKYLTFLGYLLYPQRLLSVTLQDTSNLCTKPSIL